MRGMFKRFSKIYLVPQPPYLDGSEPQAATPDNSATLRMYRSGTSSELSEPPGTTASRSSRYQDREVGVLAYKGYKLLRKFMQQRRV